MERTYLSSSPVICAVRVARFLAFCVVFRRSLFVILATVLFSVLLRFTASDYPFSILDLRLLITPLVS